MRDVIRTAFAESITLKQRTLDELAGAIEEAAVGTITRIRNGGTLFLCGNGGSAADAQHIAGELAGRFRRERDPLPLAGAWRHGRRHHCGESARRPWGRLLLVRAQLPRRYRRCCPSPMPLDSKSPCDLSLRL